MISIIIPIYNRAGLIRECLESVFAQTYPHYEVILVDDGSTDRLTDALSPYMSRIRYIKQDNHGAASARNRGIREAKGEFIAWLDSDDRWLPFKLELEMSVLEKMPPAVCFVHSDFSCFSTEGGEIAHSYVRQYFFTLDVYKLTSDTLYSSKSTVRQLGITVASVPGDTRVYWGDVSDKVILGPLFLPSSIVIRRDCLLATGFFDETMRTGEDFDLLARVARKHEVAYIDVPTLEYRRFHPDQLSSKSNELETDKVFLKVATELGFNDKEYYRKNTAFVDMRLAHCHYALGLYYYNRNQYDQALKEFITSIKMYVRQRKIYLLIIVSFIKYAGVYMRSETNQLKVKEHE
ncbi:MAG: glycosyltransferase family 2 protein [Endomicrobiales bacterium]|jgi:glycosyltransferase involved in cell wall biosynthesis